MGRLARPRASPRSRARSSPPSAASWTRRSSRTRRPRAQGRVPARIVDGMKEMGLFGLMIPEEYGGLGESLLTYALVVEEIARGWMSVSGIINTHFIVAYMLKQHGTEEQKAALLPRMATGEMRGAFSMSEPGCGSDVGHQDQGRPRRRRLRPQRPEDVAHQRRRVGPGRHAGQDRRGRGLGLPEHDDVPRREGAGLRRDAPGLTIPGKIDKMGYKGVESTEMVIDGSRVPAPACSAARTGQGLLPDDGRRRGRPRQRRGAGLRRRAAGVRARRSPTPSSA